jgi:hypothetical protein
LPNPSNILNYERFVSTKVLAEIIKVLFCRPIACWLGVQEDRVTCCPGKGEYGGGGSYEGYEYEKQSS